MKLPKDFYLLPFPARIIAKRYCQSILPFHRLHVWALIGDNWKKISVNYGEFAMLFSGGGQLINTHGNKPIHFVRDGKQYVVPLDHIAFGKKRAKIFQYCLQDGVLTVNQLWRELGGL